MFTGISKEICAQAWDILLPAIEKAAALEVTDGLRGTIIVIDPASPTHEVLFTGHVGEQEDPFLENATGKAKVTLRVGMDSSRVRQDFPTSTSRATSSIPGRSCVTGSSWRSPESRASSTR